MITSPIKAIVVTGHYAAGKGDVAVELLPLLEKHFPSLTCSIETDREFLNAAVLRDVYDEQAPKPGVEGPHSVILDAGPPLVFDVKDGALHLEAHRDMVARILRTQDGTLRVQEIASGPDVHAFGLFQSGKHLVNLLEQFGATDRTLVIDVYAPFSVRVERNAKRPDKVSDEIMNVAAIDGGEVLEVKHLLGDHYYLLDNSDDGLLAQRASDMFESFIRPNIEVTARLLEGSARTSVWRR